MKYKITIEYDGTNLVGWQKQPNQLSVQESIENAIYSLSQEKVEVIGAGRTDAGVHATGQVAHFDLQKEFPENNIRAGINFYLTEKPIVILNAKKVDDDFHARFSAQKRYYKYALLNRSSPAVLDKNRVWHMPMPLDIYEMERAADFLLGNHDFSSFRSSECQAKNPVKTLDEVDIEQYEDFIFFHVSAKSFLHNMVRNIVGTLVDVGTGKIKADDIPKILAAKDRTKAGQTAPACGLYFEGVDY
jgi:tRNA pseudouridine38-40 synthase